MADVADLMRAPEWRDAEGTPNGDGTAFLTVPWSALPPEAIVATKGFLPVMRPVA